MEHEHSDDEWGFWEPERTRRLPRLRPRDGDTRPLAAMGPGSRRHADAHVDAEAPVDEHDPLGLFDELGPVDEFPGLDDEPEVEVVATGRRSWRDLFRRDARGRPDPLVVRVGAVVLAGLIAVPILASSSGGASTAGAAMFPPTTVAAANPAPATESPSTSATEPVSTPARSKTTNSAATTSAAPASSAEPATGAIESATPCRTTYEIEAGDYWLGIADRADVDVADLLGANEATSDTPLYPGRSICLPAGAATPVPTSAAATTTEDTPATTAPPTTAKSTTTAAKSTTTADKPTTTADKPTTTADKPTTTADKPTTTAAKPVTTTAKATTTTTEAPTTTQPPRTYTRDEVAQIIRDVWPDDLEDKAIAIASRESNLTPAVRNACCFGLFQIYFSVHAGWLAQMGVTSATQLYDPLVNTQAALALYYRNGGWGPWGG